MARDKKLIERRNEDLKQEYFRLQRIKKTKKALYAALSRKFYLSEKRIDAIVFECG